MTSELLSTCGSAGPAAPSVVAPPPGGGDVVPPPPPPPPPPARREHRNRALAAVGVVAGVVVAVAVLIVTLAHGVSAPSTAAHGASPSRSASTPFPSGVNYTDPQARWSATFSGAPTYHSTTAPSVDGPLPYMYAEYTTFDVDQLVGVLLTQPGTPYDLAKGLQGLADTAHGSIVSSSSGSFQGHPSIEGVLSTSSGFFKCSFVRVGAVLYLFGTVGPANPPADYMAFASSIHLTPH
jgi:hypothetical protein